MTEYGHGLQIVNVTKSHSFVLDEEELERLLLREDVKDLPVVVVSVAGAYRGGKSFLLNFFIRYLSSPLSAREDGSWLGEDSAPLVGFRWRSGIKATTMGILMWSEPFIMTLPSKDKVAVLLVDTQGTFDNRSTVRDNSTIFALSTLLSSVQIYNLSHDIKEDDMQHLELFTEYGKLVNSDLNGKAFQVLEFLVRDWQFPDDDYPYGAVGGERLLQDKLEVVDEQAKEMKELRQHIRSSFDKVSCFLMPHPGFEVLKSSFKGNIKDISPDFKTQLKDLISSLFGPEKLLPKKINGGQVKARDLFNYFKTYMELFNSGEIPNPTNILAATVKAGLLSAVNESRDIYEKGMDSECGPKQPSVPAVDLKFLHAKYVALARDEYTKKKKMGSANEIAEYLDKLSEELEGRLSQFLQSNLSKIQTAIEKAKELYEETIQTITKDKPICVHPKDVEKIHNLGVEAALKIYDAARKRVTGINEDERDIFIKGFIKRYDYQQNYNTQNNIILVANLKNSYWQKMQIKTTIKPPLSEAEFKAEHDAELSKALEDFESKRIMPNQYTEDVYKYNLTTEIQKSYSQLKFMNKSNNREEISKAIDAYDSYMHAFWINGKRCMYPPDLEKEHKKGKCRALTVFRPKKICFDRFDSNDEDEMHLEEIIADNYEGYLKENAAANETAITLAFNEYVDYVQQSRRSVIMWGITTIALGILDPHTLLMTLPSATRLKHVDTAVKEGKEKASEVFYNQRRDGGGHVDDIYKERLDQYLEQYNEDNL